MKSNGKMNIEAWVYIYNTPWNNAGNDFIVSYKLRNKGKCRKLKLKQCQIGRK